MFRVLVRRMDPTRRPGLGSLGPLTSVVMTRPTTGMSIGNGSPLLNPASALERNAMEPMQNPRTDKQIL